MNLDTSSRLTLTITFDTLERTNRLLHVRYLIRGADCIWGA